LGLLGDDGENDRRKILREEGDWSLHLTGEIPPQKGYYPTLCENEFVL
jgi:hypothetical protein